MITDEMVERAYTAILGRVNNKQTMRIALEAYEAARLRNFRSVLTPQMIRDTAGWEQMEDDLRVTLRQAADELAAKEAENKRLRNALAECEEYFDNRADADCDQDGYIPNDEMKMLALVREAGCRMPIHFPLATDMCTVGDLNSTAFARAQEAYDRKLADMNSPTPTEEPEAGDGPLGYAIMAYISALEPQERDGWKPIETAPEEYGARFLAYDPDVGMYVVDRAYGAIVYAWNHAPASPTHWWPLPAPPHREGK